MGRQAKIAVVGSLIFDFVASADHLPRMGETVMGDRFQMNTGGTGANQAVQAARLGAKVTLVGRVGRDFQGDTILENLRRDGIDPRFVAQDERESTACCCIHVDRQGNNAIIIAPNANLALTEEDVDRAREELLASDILLLQQEIPMAVNRYAARLAQERGIPVILNPAPAVPLDRELLSLASFFTPNETEAEYYAGLSVQESPEEWECRTAQRLLELGARRVLLTLGKRGAFLMDGERKELFPAFEGIHAVDATAAGDAFHGALAVALAEGRPLEEALLFANGAGGLAASRAGAQTSLCRRAELEQFLRKNGKGLSN